MSVILQCPKIVDGFLQCKEDVDYDGVYLLATFSLNEVTIDIDHGQMTAVIRYKMPYIMEFRDLFILSFALGNNGSVRSFLE